MKQSEEFKKFDRAMDELLKVPHSEIKKKLDAEKAEKAARKKKKIKISDASQEKPSSD
jgi:hypothetical protein